MNAPSLLLPTAPRVSEAPLTHDLRDPEAFKAAALEHRRALRRVAVRLVDDEHAADDMVQEALVRAFAARGGYRGAAQPFTWLCGFVVNVCRAELRRRRVRRWLRLGWTLEPGVEASAPEPAAPPTEDGLVRDERHAALRAALARLPEGQRTALVLVSQEGLTAGEAAQALGTSEAAVWQAVSRARRALRQALTTSTAFETDGTVRTDQEGR